MELMVTPSRSSLFLRAAVDIIFGLLILSFPGLTLAIVAIAFAINLLIIGLFMIFEPAFDNDNHHGVLTVILGILLAIVGVYLLSHPLVSATVVSFLVAAWALVFGLVDLSIGFNAKKLGISGSWLFVITGILSVIFGIYVAFNPLEGTLALIWVLGLYALVVGVILGITAIFMKSNKPKKVKAKKK